MNQEPEPKHARTRPPGEPDAPERLAYRAPQLVVYGDLKRITAAKGGMRWDGFGNPWSRV